MSLSSLLLGFQPYLTSLQSDYLGSFYDVSAIKKLVGSFFCFFCLAAVEIRSAVDFLAEEHTVIGLMHTGITIIPVCIRLFQIGIALIPVGTGSMLTGIAPIPINFRSIPIGIALIPVGIGSMSTGITPIPIDFGAMQAVNSQGTNV